MAEYLRDRAKERKRVKESERERKRERQREVNRGEWGAKSIFLCMETRHASDSVFYICISDLLGWHYILRPDVSN